MLGCQAARQRREVGLIGCRAVKARVRSPGVVEIEIAAKRRAGLADAVAGPRINLLVFDAAPKAFDEHVVSTSPFAFKLIAMLLVTTTPVKAGWPIFVGTKIIGLHAMIVKWDAQAYHGSEERKRRHSLLRPWFETRGLRPRSSP